MSSNSKGDCDIDMPQNVQNLKRQNQEDCIPTTDILDDIKKKSKKVDSKVKKMSLDDNIAKHGNPSTASSSKVSGDTSVENILLPKTKEQSGYNSGIESSTPSTSSISTSTRTTVPRKEQGWKPRTNPDDSYLLYDIKPTYSDRCAKQKLFTNPYNVIVIDDEDDTKDVNEVLSVKVVWQSSEHKTFTIRRFQKLTQIFNFYAERERVSHDSLLFLYKDEIVGIDDTPDLINYNSAEFIVGILVQGPYVAFDNIPNKVRQGINLKFRLQNVRKRFETALKLDEKMEVAMALCAEHWEQPVDKLKFHFDGNVIKGKITPRDLDLEGGECIDVTIK